MADAPKHRRKKTEPAGVDSTTPDDFLVIGRVARPWGLRGDLKIQVLSDIPDRFEGLERVFIDRVPYSVIESRVEGSGAARLVLRGTRSREDADSLRGQLVEIPAAEASALPEGVYYHFQILGLRALDENGTLLGTIVEIVPTGANDVYVVRPETGPDILIPVIDEVVQNIDISGRTITVRVIEGLLPEPRAPRPPRRPRRALRRPSSSVDQSNSPTDNPSPPSP